MSDNLRNGGLEGMATFSYEHEFYTPSNLLNKIREDPEVYKNIRKDYSKFRAVAQKRLKRLGSSMFKDSQSYRKYKIKFKTLKEIKSPQELAQRMSELERFINSKTSTVSGQKEIMLKSLDTLHSNGYDFVNESNFISYGEFMEEYRNQLLDMEYDSGQAADTFEVLEKKKIDPSVIKEEFELFMKEREELEKMRVTKAMREDPKLLRQKLENRVERREKKKVRERQKKAKAIVERLNKSERRKSRKRRK